MTPPPAESAALDPLAVALNERLQAAAPEVFSMLSALGRRLYFPRGILSQSAEAKQKAHRVNATIGIATEGDGPMYLESIARHLKDIDAAEAFPYAPPAGPAKLRELWREKQLRENPSLAGKAVGLPIATSALTHGLSLVGDLFVDPGDRLVIPDKLWGNYRLLYEVRLGGQIASFPFFAGSGFNAEGFAQCLASQADEREKLVVLLNFPNNPTGYMPTRAEAESMADALVSRAESGTKLVVVVDDAYFGLFYELDGPSLTESIFGLLVNRHPNLLAARLDGPTKELFVWGLRCGFLTFGPGRADTASEVCDVLDAKTRGAIRSNVSSSPLLSQSLVRHALTSPTIAQEQAGKRERIRARAEATHAAANAPRFRESWTVYPFNSGYFMCIAVKGVDAERVRLHLLDEYGVGVIASGRTDLRIAFSCLELEEIEPLFETLHKAIQELVDSQD